MLPLTSGGGVCQKWCQSCDQTWLFVSQILVLRVVLYKQERHSRQYLVKKKTTTSPYPLVQHILSKYTELLNFETPWVMKWGFLCKAVGQCKNQTCFLDFTDTNL